MSLSPPKKKQKQFKSKVQHWNCGLNLWMSVLFAACLLMPHTLYTDVVFDTCDVVMTLPVVHTTLRRLRT